MKLECYAISVRAEPDDYKGLDAYEICKTSNKC